MTPAGGMDAAAGEASEPGRRAMPGSDVREATGATRGAWGAKPIHRRCLTWLSHGRPLAGVNGVHQVRLRWVQIFSI